MLTILYADLTLVLRCRFLYESLLCALIFRFLLFSSSSWIPTFHVYDGRNFFSVFYWPEAVYTVIGFHRAQTVIYVNFELIICDTVLF